jgi:hypothetical protein
VSARIPGFRTPLLPSPRPISVGGLHVSIVERQKKTLRRGENLSMRGSRGSFRDIFCLQPPTRSFTHNQEIRKKVNVEDLPGRRFDRLADHPNPCHIDTPDASCRSEIHSANHTVSIMSIIRLDPFAKSMDDTFAEAPPSSIQRVASHLVVPSLYKCLA